VDLKNGHRKSLWKKVSQGVWPKWLCFRHNTTVSEKISGSSQENTTKHHFLDTMLWMATVPCRTLWRHHNTTLGQKNRALEQKQDCKQTSHYSGARHPGRIAHFAHCQLGPWSEQAKKMTVLSRKTGVELAAAGVSRPVGKIDTFMSSPLHGFQKSDI